MHDGWLRGTDRRWVRREEAEDREAIRTVNIEAFEQENEAGLVDVLREALKPLSKKTKVTFIYGSFATNSAKAGSDVDLMVIGSCSFGQVVGAIGDAQETLGREINPTVYPVNEWKEKLRSRHHFTTSVSKSAKIFIIGTGDDLARLTE